MAEPPPSFPLPLVHKDLAPYIHPPSTVLLRRQILTAHLYNLSSQPRIATASGSSDEFTRFLDLELSRNSGEIRKQYLTALRDNVLAKREYAAAVSAATEYSDEEIDSDEDERNDEKNTGEKEVKQEESSGWKHSYLAVLKLRRQMERLSVLREGVLSLTTVPDERPKGGLAAAYPQRPPELPEELSPAAKKVDGGDTAVGAGSGAENHQLVAKLQKLIVEAADRLNEEVVRVKKLKDTIGVQEGNGSVRALRAVQMELVAWLDGALVNDDSTSAPPSAGDSTLQPVAPLPPPQSTVKTKTIDSLLADIATAYTEYLNSRAALLSLVTSPQHPISPLHAHPPIDPFSSTSRFDPAPSPSPPQILKVLTASEHLLPASRAQKSILMATNHHAAALSQRRAQLSEVLQPSRSAAWDVTDDGSDARLVGEAVKRAAAIREAVEKADNIASAHLHKAMEKLEDARKVAAEIELLCKGAPKKMEKKKKLTIPVRGGKQTMNSDGEDAIWMELDGGVGVIGDGI
jgi:hypothetical protein